MRKIKKFLTLAMTATLLFSSVTVNAAEVSMTAKQNADYMMSTNKDGIPNWFNGAYYSDRYEDLKIAFNTNEKALYNHSFRYGFNESRLVTPVLDVAKYRAFYPDLNKAFGDNWKLYVRHYFEYGINEGRENFTDFDAKTYLNMYDDLQNTFGTNLVLATRHYIEFGLSEGREYNLPETEIVYEETDNDNDDDNASSDSGSSDNNNTDEGFTGDKRIELSDNMYAIATYVNDMIITLTYFNSDGTVDYKTTFTYDENNILKSSKSSNADGSFDETTYYETGSRKVETNYRADGTKSNYTEYDEQGNTTFSIEYQADGEKEFLKTTFTYDENANLKSQKDTWENGATAETIYENGVRTYQISTHTDGDRIETEFYSDGQTKKKETRIYMDGTKDIGEFYENGNWKSNTYYDANGNITYQTFYDEDGNLI